MIPIHIIKVETPGGLFPKDPANPSGSVLRTAMNQPTMDALPGETLWGSILLTSFIVSPGREKCVPDGGEASKMFEKEIALHTEEQKPRTPKPGWPPALSWAFAPP